MIKNTVLDMIGNTPLIKLNKVSVELGNNVYAKAEYLNPFGSVKDRIAINMLSKAIEKGLINTNTVIIEPTSGNTGIALAGICSILGNKCILVMPSSMSKERIKVMEEYGAEVLLVDGVGMNPSIQKANDLHKEMLNSFIPSQFNNMDNPEAHYKTTAKEIYDDLDGKIDVFVAGIGTGGTISGCGKYFKERNKNILVIGFEPFESSVINNKEANKHKIQGVGAGFIPKTLDLSVVDEVLRIKSDDAIECTHKINKLESVFVGISSGGAYSAVCKYVKEKNLYNKNIVVVFPDSYYKYLS